MLKKIIILLLLSLTIESFSQSYKLKLVNIRKVKGIHKYNNNITFVLKHVIKNKKKQDALLYVAKEIFSETIKKTGEYFYKLIKYIEHGLSVLLAKIWGLIVLGIAGLVGIIKKRISGNN